MTNSNINSAFTPILVALTTLTLYLISGSLVNARASPPFFFTVGLGLIFAAYVMTPLVALAAVGAIFFAELFLALDHIHGECWYGVMVGGSSWHKERLGELAWHRQCVQSSQAWWIMAVLGLLWMAILIIEVYKRWQASKSKAVYLPIAQEAEAESGEARPSTNCI
ncbi:hypothetical protein I317_00949 [Kwoniella heveanensis CBS 569]|nr:hypothetical protein I317_00949 [Kwoniella heveanensis CBS 569]